MISCTSRLVAGAARFFTLSLTDSTQCSLVDHIDHLRDAFFQVKQHYPFAMPAVVILPDHLHAIWQLPEGDSDYASRWKAVTARFARVVEERSAAQAKTGEPGLWQQPVQQRILRDEAELKKHTDFIHFDPVKHGLVAMAADWPHSSFHNHVRNSLLPRDWAGSRDLSLSADSA